MTSVVRKSSGPLTVNPAHHLRWCTFSFFQFRSHTKAIARLGTWTASPGRKPKRGETRSHASRDSVFRRIGYSWRAWIAFAGKTVWGFDSTNSAPLKSTRLTPTTSKQVGKCRKVIPQCGITFRHFPGLRDQTSSLRSFVRNRIEKQTRRLTARSCFRGIPATPTPGPPAGSAPGRSDPRAWRSGSRRTGSGSPSP